jgi:diguanylate cyclase (GGDEF)-like protein/PAS domain S-box-containing protein
MIDWCKLYPLILENLGSGLIVISEERTIVYANQKACEFLKRQKEDLIGRNARSALFALFSEGSSCSYEALLQEGKVCEFDALLNRGNEETFFAHIFATLIRHEGRPYVLVNFYDITPQKELVKSLYQAAITDPLTGLYNRRFADEMLKQEKLAYKRYQTPFCILLIDLDNFKIINDVYGHDVGDKVLVAVANVLKRNVRESDIVARWGGEEFLILLRRIELEDAIKVAEKIRNAICQLKVPPVEGLTASIGVSCYSGEEDVYNLVRKADLALYQAKAQGKNCVILF